jgi:DNA-binding CsgD family transcriptional regulator
MENGAHGIGKPEATLRRNANVLGVAVRRLLSEIRVVRRQQSRSEAPDDVLLDVEVDGARCLVLRVDPDVRRVRLTPRERQIVELVTMGCPNKTIAVRLHISHWTVGSHLRRLFTKLRVSSRAELVARAMDQGLLAMRVPPSPAKTYAGGSERP